MGSSDIFMEGRMNYTQQLESLLEEILNQFDNDPNTCGYTHDDDEGQLLLISSELSGLLDRANDLIYGTESVEEQWGLGFSTEEGE